MQNEAVPSGVVNRHGRRKSRGSGGNGIVSDGKKVYEVDLDKRNLRDYSFT